MEYIGRSVFRKEALDKVTGKANYTADENKISTLHISMVTSPYGHANILEINCSKARKTLGVRAVVLGSHDLPLTGEEIRDRPPIAVDKVRYHGEPIALVVADTPVIAKRAADLVDVRYEILKVVNSPTEALSENAPLVHQDVISYQKIGNANPIPNSNISNITKIRKGNVEQGWRESNVVVEDSYRFSPSAHAAMETRTAIVEIKPTGYVHITSSSQAPFMLKKLLSTFFSIDEGKIIVQTPLVGGAYGGKASVQWEILAYLASRAVGGKRVKIVYSREEDLITAPCHIGLEAKVKIGCTKEGMIKATEIVYLFDGGAYSDKAIDVSRAGAVDCTGPYNIENVQCDSYCLYTNHPYATAYRGFSHSEVLFAFERTMDKLANKLGMDPIELRKRNAILPGHTTPTQVKLNKSNVGNLPACINRLKELINWDQGQIHRIDERIIRVKGICCVWKTSTIDTDATSGVILTFNPDGSINLMSGVVEIGTGTKTILAQILAERMKMSIDQIHVKMTVDTQTTPEHWKTVASRATLMAGRAVLAAAEDCIQQIKDIASQVLRCTIDDLEVANGRVFLRDDPDVGLEVKDVAYGYKYSNGNAIGGQIIGRGNYILRGMTTLNPETGAGKPGPEWTVGAQGVEIDFDERDLTYSINRAISVLDIGKVLNFKGALGQVMGAMSMGLAFAGRETFVFDDLARIMNPQLRTYRPIHYGETPTYIIDFVETPHLEAPYGARGIGEQGLIGMPAALGNCLTVATGVALNQLPLTPELIWKSKGQTNDSV
ncbi:xanthine dehydrogenase family protein molybdopterin-binding subunit [Metabacillus litoralis]|uniref:xanthine dehydrogenase family protein molybdopterin-binding subunit n=1 Tax=Metabacillus litoralis TaxID=152268 RepID=UPI00203C8C00|nr:xanthine dehydrogenase family protein molybdopterin-binding subunit [Metabacillus litoralis]MCM3651929.1 xanthine dehydrogenase family protein molybdopterin-binding subunit [Metabacillus litoralis]